MSKLSLVVLACLATLAASQTPASSSGGGCSGSWTGTEPQVNGKSCSQVTKDDCTFIDQVAQCCASQCVNASPGPSQTNQPGKHRKKKGCFHGEDTVQTREYGTIKMNDLVGKRDAHVLTRNDEGNLEYSSVRYWLHAQPSVSMQFYQLRTESGHRLTLSAEHLIHESDCKGGSARAIYAKNVRVGRCLFVQQDERLVESRVAQKRQETKKGIYSPITTTGTIVVNDVLASCYNYYENEYLQKWVYQYMIYYQDALAKWLPTSLYQAAFNQQDGAIVAVPRIILNIQQLSKVLVH